MEERRIALESGDIFWAESVTKERGKEGMPCCKSVLKEILLDDDDEDMMMVTGQGTNLTWKKLLLAASGL